jgi:hypothetical protein
MRCLTEHANGMPARFPSLEVAQPISLIIGLVRETVDLETVLAATFVMAAFECLMRDYGGERQYGAKRFHMDFIR